MSEMICTISCNHHNLFHNLHPSRGTSGTQMRVSRLSHDTALPGIDGTVYIHA